MNQEFRVRSGSGVRQSIAIDYMALIIIVDIVDARA